MVKAVTLRQVAGSVSATLPKDMATRLRLARNHPYNDGNTRVALVAMLTFLAINGLEFEAEDDDVLTTMLALAAGHLSEGELAAWLRTRLVPVK